MQRITHPARLIRQAVNRIAEKTSGRSAIRRIIHMLLLACLLPMLTGCWDRLEIEERALVLGIGIDLASDKELKAEAEVSHLKGSFPVPKTPGIKLTAQIAIPGRIPLGPGEGGGGSGNTKPVWVLSAVGHTVDDAINNLQQELADRMFFGHLRVVVLSKEYVEAGMTDINDYMRRTPDVRRTTWMVVCEDKAEDLMKMAPQLERVPSLYLLATMDQAVRMGKLPNAFVGTFWTAESALGMDPFLPYVKLVENGNMQIAGLALFSGNKMVGVTEPLEIGAYMAIKAINPGGYSLMIKIPDSDTFMMYQITQRTSHIKVSIRDGVPEFVVGIHNEGNVNEKSNENVRLDAATIKIIEEEMMVNATKGLNALIKKTQDKGSDIFGFGEYVRAKEPGFWNEHVRTTENWEKIYKDVKVRIEANYSIRRVGGKAV